MNPSVDLRIHSMMRALTEVVLPAVDPDNSLAQEQVRLLLGHLHALTLHYRDEARLDEQSLIALETLAHELLAQCAGGAGTLAAAKAVQVALVASDTRELSRAIESLMIASGVDGEPAFQAASAALVMTHARSETWRGRTWFKAMGFDAAPDSLPTIDQLLHGNNTP